MGLLTDPIPRLLAADDGVPSGPGQAQGTRSRKGLVTTSQRAQLPPPLRERSTKSGDTSDLEAMPFPDAHHHGRPLEGPFQSRADWVLDAPECDGETACSSGRLVRK